MKKVIINLSEFEAYIRSIQKFRELGDPFDQGLDCGLDIAYNWIKENSEPLES